MIYIAPDGEIFNALIHTFPGYFLVIGDSNSVFFASVNNIANRVGYFQRDLPALIFDSSFKWFTSESVQRNCKQ